jgi:conjugative transfer region lipoprotein (TIGR03751 family)
MRTMTRSIAWGSLLITALVLAGCSSKDAVIPESNIKSEDILDAAMGGGKEARDYRIMTTPQMAGVQPDVNVYELHNAPKPRYQTLPNPTLFIFVPAHLTGKARSPVPAYITETKMFDRDEYALPGELYPMSDPRYKKGQAVANDMTYQN